MAQQYYAEEITAVPFRVMGRAMSTAAPAPLAYALAAYFRFRGLIGWPLKPTYALGEPGSERVVEHDALPPRALAGWAVLAGQLEELGFQPLRFAIADVIGEKEHVAGTYLDPTGTTIATLEWMRMRGAQGIEERTPLEMNSYADQDPEIMTGAIRPEDAPLAEIIRFDFIDMVLLPITLSVEQVYKQHLARVSGRPMFEMTPEAALDETRKRAQRRFEAAREKGLLRPIGIGEVSRLRNVRLEDFGDL